MCSSMSYISLGFNSTQSTWYPNNAASDSTRNENQHHTRESNCRESWNGWMEGGFWSWQIVEGGIFKVLPISYLNTSVFKHSWHFRLRVIRFLHFFFSFYSPRSSLISSPPQTNARFNYTHTELLCIGYLSIKFMSVGDQQHGSIWVLKLKSRKTLFVCYTDVRTKSLTHIKLKCNSFVLLWLSPRLPCHARSKEGFRGVNQTDCVTNTRRTVWFVCTPLNVLGHPSIELKGWWGGWWWTTLPNDLHSEFSSGKKRDLLISVRNTCKYPSYVYWWSH